MDFLIAMRNKKVGYLNNRKGRNPFCVTHNRFSHF